MPFVNPEKKREYGRMWARKNYQRFKKKKEKYMKLWRAKNPDKVLAQKTRYSRKHAEKIRQKSHAYYHTIGKFRYKERYENDPKFRKEIWEKNQEKLKRKRELLLRLRKELGGKCAHCGYKKDIRILQFHHHNGSKIDNVTNLQSFKKIEAEAKKCILLCPNCHALEHLNK